MNLKSEFVIDALYAKLEKTEETQKKILKLLEEMTAENVHEKNNTAGEK